MSYPNDIGWALNCNKCSTAQNVRGIRETALKKIRKLYGNILSYRKENSLPMTLDVKYFLENGVRKKV